MGFRIGILRNFLQCCIEDHEFLVWLLISLNDIYAHLRNEWTKIWWRKLMPVVEFAYIAIVSDGHISTKILNFLAYFYFFFISFLQEHTILKDQRNSHLYITWTKSGFNLFYFFCEFWCIYNIIMILIVNKIFFSKN